MARGVRRWATALPADGWRRSWFAARLAEWRRLAIAPHVVNSAASLPEKLGMVRQDPVISGATSRRFRRCIGGHGEWLRDGRRLRQGGNVPELPLFLSLILCGCVMAAAAATGRHPWLGLVALLPLFRLIQVSRPAWAMFGGAVFGVSLCACGAAIAPRGLPLTPATVLLLITVCSTYAYVGARLTRWIGFSPYLLGIGWILVELALHPLGLRYGLLAGTQGDGIFVNAVGGLLGYVFVAFVVAYANAWLLAILSKLRLPLSRPVDPVGLDGVGWLLWQLVSSGCPEPVPCVSRPRAPPTRA